MKRLLIVAALLASVFPADAQAAATTSDQQFLAGDSTFISRVGEGYLNTCTQISSESTTGLSGSMPITLHLKRANFCSSSIQPSQFVNWKPIIAAMVATDATVIGDATQGGTVALTGAATGQALVTDAHIANAISSQLNTLLSEP